MTFEENTNSFIGYGSYNELVADSSIEDKVLVQGVVDLLIEKENEIVLIDYKFSRLPTGILKKKYIEQLNLYKKANFLYTRRCSFGVFRIDFPSNIVYNIYV